MPAIALTRDGSLDTLLLRHRAMRGWAAFSDARCDRFALVSIAAGALLRAVWVFVVHPPWEFVYSDMQGYVSRAQDLVRGVPLDRYDAFYPPGTHLLLSVPLFVAGPGQAGLWLAATVWWAAASVTPFLTWRMARTLLTAPAAAIAASLVSLYPLHISYAGYFLSEVPAMAFLAGALWLGHRALARREASVGALFAVGALGAGALVNRPQFLFNLALVAVPLAVAMWPRPSKLAALALGAALPIALVLAHNTAAAGRIVGLNENGGITFYAGHCEVRRVSLGEPGSFYISPPPFLEQGGREEHFPDARPWDQGFFYARAFNCIRADGLGHVRVLARGLLDMGATTVPWPQAEEPALRASADLVNGAYTLALPAIVLLSIRLVQRRRARGERAGEATLLAHLAMIVPVALIVFGDPRFRTPYDLFGLSLAGAVLAWAFIERRLDAGSARVRPDVMGAQHR